MHCALVRTPVDQRKRPCYRALELRMKRWSSFCTGRTFMGQSFQRAPIEDHWGKVRFTLLERT